MERQEAKGQEVRGLLEVVQPAQAENGNMQGDDAPSGHVNCWDQTQVGGVKLCSDR